MQIYCVHVFSLSFSFTKFAICRRLDLHVLHVVVHVIIHYMYRISILLLYTFFFDKNFIDCFRTKNRDQEREQCVIITKYGKLSGRNHKFKQHHAAQCGTRLVSLILYFNKKKNKDSVVEAGGKKNMEKRTCLKV